jgi:UDP-N-acetylglucosamine--N-acetylmuramyl-(pentapeptide) pyrophosphoryl-undecaprenol N-acetylglucosamine transferase
VRLVLTGGGTGGHVYPAIAIAQAFADEATFAPLEVTFVGTRGGLEASIVPKARLPIAFVHAAPLTRALSFSLVRTVVDNVRGFFEALAVLHRARPDVLIATGGYVAFPVVSALRAVRLIGRSRARIALLEPNAVAGLTNRILAPLVDEIWYAIAPAHGAADAFVTGTPVRASMRALVSRADARTRLGLPTDATVVVAMGGSQGARSINDAVARFVEAGLPPGYHVLVIAGARDLAALTQRLAGKPGATVLGYLDDPRDAYAAADIVVARSGASTLGELAATQTPALLVPYPFATADHQRYNAEAYARSGAAIVLADRDLSETTLRETLRDALAPARLQALRDGAAQAGARAPHAAIVARVKSWPLAKTGAP